MTYQKFIETLLQELKQSYGDEYIITMEGVLKNNGIVKDALLIRKEGETIIPNLYVDKYYELYCQKANLSMITKQIWEDYMFALNNKPKEFPLDLSYKNMEKRIFFRIVHRERNNAKLKNCPWVAYEDLAFTFHLLLSDKGMQVQSISITNNMLKKWEISLEELMEIALKNTPILFPIKLASLSSYMECLMRDRSLLDEENSIFSNHSVGLEEMEQVLAYDEALPLTIISNSSGVNGAGAIFYEEVLSRISDFYEKDIYILPSSIHECIVFPKEQEDTDYLIDMVRDVNRTKVQEDEVLSDAVYLYPREEGKIIKIAG